MSQQAGTPKLSSMSLQSSRGTASGATVYACGRAAKMNLDAVPLRASRAAGGSVRPRAERVRGLHEDVRTVPEGRGSSGVNAEAGCAGLKLQTACLAAPRRGSPCKRQAFILSTPCEVDAEEGRKRPTPGSAASGWCGACDMIAQPELLRFAGGGGPGLPSGPRSLRGLSISDEGDCIGGRERPAPGRAASG